MDAVQPLFEVAIVVVATLAAISIVGFTLQVGISPMPSSAAACRAVLAAVPEPAGPVIDLGSGWGTLAIAFARQHPDVAVIGYEVSWVPWLASLAFKGLLRLDNLSFRLGDFRRAKLPDAATVLCYLYPGGMRSVASLLRDGRLDPQVVVSNTFALPSVPADEVLRLPDLYRTHICLYRRPLAGWHTAFPA